MNRKKFLRTGAKALSMLSVGPFFMGVNKQRQDLSEDCETTPRETAGPFPTKNPATLEIVDIRSDRAGVPLEVLITVRNHNKDCAPLAGAIVDIWHCDKDGYYSEYGGMRMQRQDFTEAHFLRGRQISDEAGQVAFTSIFPGWYRGRAPHIHVEIFDAEEQSLLVTQIAFPGEVYETVYGEAAELYHRGMPDTPNSRDGIFADSLAAELAELEGNVASGYRLQHTIIVKA